MESDTKSFVIAATSDIHGFIDGIYDEVNAISPNVVVIAGDLHPCYLDINPYKWFTETFFPLVKSLKIPVVAIPGNHDFWLQGYLSGREKVEIPKNLHLLCDSAKTIGGVKFYGTPWVPWINGRWCWEASDNSLEYQFSKIPNDVEVLITHSPPHINHEFVDISLDNSRDRWRHFGSKHLMEAIRRVKPKVSICGHIHSGQHRGVIVRDKNGASVCLCYNVSRVNERYNVVYPIEKIILSRKS